MGIFTRHTKARELPDKSYRVLMAEIVDDYTPLALQSERYEIYFDPKNLSPDKSHYNFGRTEYRRLQGWKPVSYYVGQSGFYIVTILGD